MPPCLASEPRGPAATGAAYNDLPHLLFWISNGIAIAVPSAFVRGAARAAPRERRGCPARAIEVSLRNDARSCGSAACGAIFFTPCCGGRWKSRTGGDHPPGLGACLGSFGVLARDNSGRCSGDLLGQREIELDAGERLVEAELVDLCRLSNALHSGDEFIASAEGEIVVQVLVAVYIDLGR